MTLINKNHLTNINIEEFGEKIDDYLVEIEGVFKEEGYIIANVNKIASIPDRIEKIVKISDKLGETFYEIILKS